MIEAYETHGGNHIAVSPVPEEQTHQYGIVGVEDAKRQGLAHHRDGREAEAGQAPSNLHITGRYILQPEIFDHSRTRREERPAARSSSPTP